MVKRNNSKEILVFKCFHSGRTAIISYFPPLSLLRATPSPLPLSPLFCSPMGRAHSTEARQDLFFCLCPVIMTPLLTGCQIRNGLMQANTMHIQISYASGSRKEKTPGLDFCGFLIMMEMPKLMKGLEKSITSSRTRVIVRGATAISALWKYGIE